MAYLIKSNDEFKHCQKFLFSNCSWNSYLGEIKIDIRDTPLDKLFTFNNDEGFLIFVTSDNKMLHGFVDTVINPDRYELMDGRSIINYNQILREDKLTRILKK